MRKLTSTLTTTRLDRHGYRMTVDSLVNGAEQINRLYVPFGVEHDPRIAPIGRIVAAKVVPMKDGEHALEAEIELFEPGDDLPLQDEGREIPMRKYPSMRLQVVSDMGFEDANSQRDLAELSGQLGTDQAREMKKSLEPIAVLIIGGAAFVLGQLSQGFLGRLGEDGYEFLKAKLKHLVGRRQASGKDTLLQISLVVPLQGQDVEIEIHCTNPSGTAIDHIVRKQLQRIDDALPTLFDARLGMRKLVFEYQEGEVRLRFAVRRDAVPLFPRLDPVDRDGTEE